MTSQILRFLNNTPFLRYLAFYICGILLYWLGIKWYFVFGSVGFLAILIFLARYKIYSRQTPKIAFLHFALPLISYASCMLMQDDLETNFVLKKGEVKAFKCVIYNKSAKERFEAKIENVHTQNKWKMASGDLALTVIGTGGYALYDTLYILGCPGYLKAPQNPEEFNHRDYFKSKGIWLQYYTQSSKIIQHKKYQGFSIKNMALSLREYFSKRLREYIDNENNASISEALILGVRTEISDELLKAYSLTGTIHVLAVSGMHVGLLFGSVAWIFSIIFGAKHKSKYAILALLLMWFFALITGFSSSVVRASVMYTVYQIGNMSGKKINIMNTLFSSSFFILVLQPFMLFDVGFQLSFFAVLGIVSIQPFFQRWFETEGFFFKSLRDLLTVSISAQLGVLPISIFYFHQFPNLFIISNLIEVTLSTFALYVGILALIFSPVDYIMKILCLILDYLIEAMNMVALWLSKLPFAISSLYIDLWQALLLALMILFFVVFIRSKKVAYLKMTLLTCVLFSAYGWAGNYKKLYDSRLHIYSNRKEQFVDVFEHGYLTRLRFENDGSENLKLRQTLETNKLKNTLYPKHDTLTVPKETALMFSINGTSFQLINSYHALVDSTCKYVFLYKVPKKAHFYKHQTLIVRRRKEKEALVNLGCKTVHCLEQEGAFVK